MVAMMHEEPSLSSPVDADDEAEHLVREYDAKLKLSDETIARLEQALREATEQRQAISFAREEAVALCGVGPRLRMMRQRAAEHGILPGRGAPSAGLHIVPDAADEPAPSPSQTPPVPDTAHPASAPAPEGPEKRPAELLIIRSKKQQSVLTALTSRDETEPLWGSEEIAQALDIPKDATERKSLRNCLQALVLCGALERVTYENDRHVYYRPLMNWTFA